MPRSPHMAQSHRSEIFPRRTALLLPGLHQRAVMKPSSKRSSCTSLTSISKNHLSRLSEKPLLQSFLRLCVPPPFATSSAPWNSPQRFTAAGANTLGSAPGALRLVGEQIQPQRAMLEQLANSPDERVLMRGSFTTRLARCSSSEPVPAAARSFPACSMVNLPLSMPANGTPRASVPERAIPPVADARLIKTSFFSSVRHPRKKDARGNDGSMKPFSQRPRRGAFGAYAVRTASTAAGPQHA